MIMDDVLRRRFVTLAQKENGSGSMRDRTVELQEPFPETFPEISARSRTLEVFLSAESQCEMSTLDDSSAVSAIRRLGFH